MRTCFLRWCACCALFDMILRLGVSISMLTVDVYLSLDLVRQATSYNRESGRLHPCVCSSGHAGNEGQQVPHSCACIPVVHLFKNASANHLRPQRLCGEDAILDHALFTRK